VAVASLPQRIAASEKASNPQDTREVNFTWLTAVHPSDAIASLNDPSPLNQDIDSI